MVDTTGYAHAVAISGDVAYVACGQDNGEGQGLVIVDVRTPLAPVEVGFIERLVTPGMSRCRAATRTWGGQEIGLHVIDVTHAGSGVS